MAEVIHLLPDNIANQIAAGEVIQRPASVVKELMENAVDAGANSIELHIKDAGKTAIQVIDNGKGMSEIDAQMAFERHATSKLTSAADLFDLHTKGFRGEALASIAAIAHVTLETIEEGCETGTKIEIQGSKITQIEPCSRVQGTSFTVKNLFFNVPARRNFLSSEQTETKHIVTEFYRIVLTHPEISFTFSHNGNVLYNLEASSLRKRIIGVFGANYNTKLVPIEEETDIVKVSGFIVKPEFARKTRGEQFFFVNQRFFKDNYFNHAIISGYNNLIATKTYPSYFIFLEVPPKTLDVNIHPTKTEVKFEDSKNIYRILHSTVKLALGKYNVAPSLDFDHEPQFDLTEEERKRPIVKPTVKFDPDFNPFHQKGKDTQSRNTVASGRNSLQPNKEEWQDYYKITEEIAVQQQTDLSSEEAFTASTELNALQLHKKYLFTQVKSGMLIIHINRANERILYDELMKNFMLSPIASQQLMFPFEHTLQKTEKLEWENNATHLKRLGFEWDWNDKTLVLSSIPAVLVIENITNCIDAIVERIAYMEIDKGELVHELIVSLAKAATQNKSKKLTQEEMDTLIERLFQRENHQFSPRGKRIINTITLNEIAKYL